MLRIPCTNGKAPSEKTYLPEAFRFGNTWINAPSFSATDSRRDRTTTWGAEAGEVVAHAMGLNCISQRRLEEEVHLDKPKITGTL